MSTFHPPRRSRLRPESHREKIAAGVFLVCNFAARSAGILLTICSRSRGIVSLPHFRSSRECVLRGGDIAPEHGVVRCGVGPQSDFHKGEQPAMRKVLAICLAVCFVFALSALAFDDMGKSATVKGWVTDDKCGAKGANDKARGLHQEVPGRRREDGRRDRRRPESAEGRKSRCAEGT